MAYNAANEERTELCAIQKNNRGDFVIATKILNKTTGSVSVDIRQYYTNDDDQVSPKSKGVRFNAENLLELMKALAEALETNEMMDLAEELENLASVDDEDMPE